MKLVEMLVEMSGLLAAIAVPSAATPPAGRWAMDTQPDMCVVSRHFGSDTKTIGFAISPATDIGSHAATLYFIIPDSHGTYTNVGTASLVLQPSGKAASVFYISGGKDGRRGYKVYADADLMTAIEASSTIGFSGGGKHLILAVGDMRPVVAALADCNRALLKSWGVDPDARADPTANPATWFSDADYPKTARLGHTEGHVAIALTVPADGKPSACRVVVSSRNKELDETSCRLAMLRGKFERVGATGNRYSILSIRWVLGGY